jgi:molybdopterin-guanine dinucleotide biosynthesis protein A
VTAAILAGGRSCRMGRDKALVPWRGKPLIWHAADTLQGLFQDVCVISDHVHRYDFLGLPVRPDIIPESGPLGGIHAALSWSEASSVFILSCDMPLVSRALVEYVLRYPPSAEVTVVAMNGRLQPLCGVYRASCLPPFERALKDRRLKLTDIISGLHHIVIQIGPELPFYDTRLLTNINDGQAYNQLITQEVASFLVD